jgi:hypothetical protein
MVFQEETEKKIKKFEKPHCVGEQMSPTQLDFSAYLLFSMNWMAFSSSSSRPD